MPRLLTTDTASMLRQTLRIRMVEERIIDIYPSDRIQSPVHLSIGQEATAVGICAPLSDDDLLFSNYRGHAYYLAKGGDLNAFFAELFGRAAGMAGGKAGSMHLAAPEVGFQGCSAIVASSIPHAVGAALAARRLGKAQRIVTVFGDGAAEEGVYHESLNFAALHKLPVIFVCENNGYAVHAPQSVRQAFRIQDSAELFGMSYTHIADGHDPSIVQERFAAAIDEIDGPAFVEIKTHRHKEHVGTGDDFDAGYRSRSTFEAWNAKDPLVQDPALEAAWSGEITAEIDAAVAFAEAAPLPSRDVLLDHVI